MLSLENIHFGFGKPLFSGMNLELPRTGAFQVYGPNGSGKSSLLRLLLGSLKPHQGRIRWAETVRFGYVPSPGLSFYPRLTAQQNLDYFASLNGLKADIKLFTDHDPFGIDFWNVPVEELSSGMYQKLAWVRAHLGKPQVYLLDEAFTGLDTESRAQAEKFLQQEKSRALILLAQHEQKLFPLLHIRNQRLEREV